MSTSLISKLAIGTVQFGLDYGISNKLGKTSSDEVKKILDVAEANNLRVLDTAFAYGESEKVLGSKNLKSFKVVSKFPPLNDKSIRHYLESSLESLNQKSVYGYLAHNADDLVEKVELWDELITLKEAGLTSKIGYSVYHPKQLEQLINLDMVADVIQLPYNILDRRFENYFEDLNKLNVEIHTRSSFLQGLLLMNPNSLNEYFSPIKNDLLELNRIAENITSKIGILLQFSLQNRFINSVVIGVNSADQLSENIAAVKKDYNYSLDIKIKDESILNPSNWPSK